MYSWNVMKSIKPSISNVGEKRDLILYLDRGGHINRGVVNNKEIIEFLEEFVGTMFGSSYQFIVKSGKENSFDLERDIYSRAMIVIGPHGGMFGNMIFMQYGSYVVEFNGWLNNDHRPFYYALSQSNGLHYYYVAPEKFEYIRHRMTIDTAHLGSVLSEILNKISET